MFYGKTNFGMAWVNGEFFGVGRYGE